MKETIRQLLAYIDPEPDREGLKDTPKRVLKAWEHLFSGYRKNPENELTLFEPDGYQGLVVLQGCEFISTCEHHLLPFFGVAHIAYLPRKRIVGISKLARVLEIYARRLQNQERLTQQVAMALQKSELHPRGAACIIRAQHLCMMARGVEKKQSVMVTASLTGVFNADAQLRAELYSIINA